MDDGVGDEVVVDGVGAEVVADGVGAAVPQVAAETILAIE